MKVVHVSTSDLEGGAARSAYRLAVGLRGQGVDASMLVKRKRSPEPWVLEVGQGALLGRRAREWLRRARIRLGRERYRATLSPTLELFTDCRSSLKERLLEELPECDLLNLHWVAGFVDWEHFFPLLPPSLPVVWTLHDMNPFTGGCHYDQDCGKFRGACGECPQLGSSMPRDLSFRTWARKRASLEGIPSDRLTIVCPSAWLARCAEESSVLGRFPRHVIPYGIDTETFTPQNREMARRKLGLDPHASLLLFVAAGLHNPRKGFPVLREAIEHLAHSADLHLLSAGKTESISFPVPHTALGHLESNTELCLAYSAADLLVLPSLQDNLPNTALEALACGTPVVGSDVGGIPFMVRPRETGQLVPPGNPRALAQAISALLADPEELLRLRSNCRRVAEEEFSLARQAIRYRDLYESLLAK